MKMLKLSLVVLVAMVLPCFAGSPGPQAYGPLKFGMAGEEADKAQEKLLKEMERRKLMGDTGAFVRKHFVIDGTRSPSKLPSSKDKMVFSVGTGNNPETKTLNSVIVHKDIKGAETYDQTAKEAWEVLRDIALSKFRAPKAGAGAGVFPTLAALQGSETIVPARAPFPGTTLAMYAGSTGEKKSIVTDVWETPEGVRVELSVDQRLPDLMVRVVLKATEVKK